MPTFVHDKRDFLLAAAATAVGTGPIASAGAARAQGTALFASIRRAKVKPNSSEELARRVPAVVLPTLRSLPGFVSFQMIYGEDDQVTAITLYTNAAAAGEANAKIVPMVREIFAPLLAGPLEPSTGSVIASALA